MRIVWITFVLLLMGAISFAQDAPAAPANLLTNGNFADVADGKPAGWAPTVTDQTITVDKDKPPKDLAQSLKVEIKKTAEGQAAITQAVRNVPPNTKLVLSGQLKGTAGRLGYLQVKLKKAGKELKREKTEWNPAGDWAIRKIEFDTADADEVSVELRFSQNDKAKDQAVWFADVTLAKAQP